VRSLPHSFDNTDGWEPEGVLIQGTDGAFYGTTLRGGTSGDGSAFKITSPGAFTPLHSFDFTDGYEPQAGLIQASDGNFYGTTYFGGATGPGTIFEMTPAGIVITPLLHSFSGGDGGTDGCGPSGALVQHTSGVLFGITSGCGSGELGTVFSEDTGLGAFVKTVPPSGKVGTTVTILGTDLSSTSSVKFNGVDAVIKAVSASHISTSVPMNATTGIVQVVTSGGTLESIVNFVVP
jgi:uncharacterized repeat protein (TIGR03803 family)